VFVKIETSICCSLFVVKLFKFFFRTLDVIRFINIEKVAKKIINILCFSYFLCILLQEVVISIDSLAISIKSLEALDNLLL